MAGGAAWPFLLFLVVMWLVLPLSCLRKLEHGTQKMELIKGDGGKLPTRWHSPVTATPAGCEVVPAFVFGIELPSIL